MSLADSGVQADLPQHRRGWQPLRLLRVQLLKLALLEALELWGRFGDMHVWRVKVVVCLLVCLHHSRCFTLI